MTNLPPSQKKTINTGRFVKMEASIAKCEIVEKDGLFKLELKKGGGIVGGNTSYV